MASGRIEKGQPIAKAISAAAWNRAQDAADVVLGVTPERLAEPATHAAGASNIALIRNDSGLDVKAAGILGFGGLAVQPAADSEMPSIVTRPILIGTTATESAGLNNFAITLEPIKSGKIGRAAVCGVVAFRLIRRDSSHQFAVVKNGMNDRLQSAACGTLRIIASTGVGQDSWVWVMGAF
jgi:hypothetical protein